MLPSHRRNIPLALRKKATALSVVGAAAVSAFAKATESD